MNENDKYLLRRQLEDIWYTILLWGCYAVSAWPITAIVLYALIFYPLEFYKRGFFR